MNEVLQALSVVTKGEVYQLALPRFPRMPLPEMHPPFEVLPYRTPAGLRVDETQEWLRGSRNAEQMHYTSDLILGSTHTGTHFDTFSHVTVGEDDHWFGGHNVASNMTDFGPVGGDAGEMGPLVTRGVLLDVAEARGVKSLSRNEPISGEEIEVLAEQVDLRPGDAALIRTGYLSHWPNKEELREFGGAGITLEAAEHLAELNVAVVGADTEAVEQLPTSHSSRPQPVHMALLVEAGIPLLEMVYLEQLASLGIREFCFIASPIKIRGATGALVDPIAII